MSKSTRHCPTGQQFVFVYCDGFTHQAISMSEEFTFNNGISQKFDDQLVSLFSSLKIIKAFYLINLKYYYFLYKNFGVIKTNTFNLSTKILKLKKTNTVYL